MEDTWTPLIAVHAVVATLAMVLGAAQIVRRRRGDRPHRTIGWVWLVCMYFVAFSSFWIQQLRPGSFSWIHGLSAFTILTLSLGLFHARRGNIRHHAGNMIGTYVGLWGAFIGVVAVPSRLVPQAFQSSWLGMTVLTAAIIAVGLALVAAVVRLLPEPTGASASASAGGAGRHAH